MKQVKSGHGHSYEQCEKPLQVGKLQVDSLQELSRPLSLGQTF